MHVEIMFLNEGLILWTLKTFILVDPDDHFNGDDDFKAANGGLLQTNGR